MSKVNKDQLIEKIAAQSNVSKKEVEDVLNAFADVVTGIMKAGDEAVLTGFGAFLARKREARMGVNRQKPTERIRIPTVMVPKFKAGKTLKDALKAEAAPAPTPAPSAPPPVVS